MRNIVDEWNQNTLRRRYKQFSWFFLIRKFLFVFKKIDFFCILDHYQRNRSIQYYLVIYVYNKSYEKHTNNPNITCMQCYISVISLLYS